MSEGKISLMKFKQDVEWNDKTIHKYNCVVGNDMGVISYWGDDPIDEIGATIEYTFEEGKFGPEIKKPRASKGGGGGGAFGAKADPAKTASIERQTSLKAAVEVAPTFGIKKLQDLLKLAEEFHKFITQEAPKKIEENGEVKKEAPKAKELEADDLPF